MEKAQKRSFFESKLMRTKIKSQNVSLFPEAGLGYLLGPILALLSNGVINIWLIQYWDKVLGLGSWAPLFETLLPIISSIVIVIGNLFVGRLMERKPSLAGKARPLILLGMPAVAVALLALFLVPFPTAAQEETVIAGLISGNVSTEGGLLASIIIAVGYNLYYAIAWPIYFTSHSALVNLSTRDSGKRGLLSTAVMAAQLAAAGVSGMFGGLLIDLLGLLPVYTYSDAYIAANNLGDITFTNDFNEVAGLTQGTDYTITISRQQANEKWTILMIVMIVALIVGCILEYFFTRERITEETVKLNEKAEASGENKKEPKKVSMKQQFAICAKDKYWWFIMIFWFLYQFGGQMKNNAMSFYSQALTGGNSVSSLINTVGAIPTALGMALVWPLANKFTKAKTISLGGIVAALAAAAGFTALAFVGNTAAVAGISVASFCIKALGTAPAMYISLALMANVLDHQEAVHGVRTDGLSMAIYGSLIVASAGICNGIIVGLNAAFPNDRAFLHTFLAYGVEGICYLIIAIMFLFMGVEKFTKLDGQAIIADQKKRCDNLGIEYVAPDVRMKLEEEEAKKETEKERIAKLKEKCEKQGLDFTVEEQKYQNALAEKQAAADAKKKEAEEKKAAKEAEAKAKYDALSPEEKQALEEKKAAKDAKQAKRDAEVEKEFEALRDAAASQREQVLQA